MSLDSQLREQEFARKRPFDHTVTQIGKSYSDITAIGIGIGSLVGTYLHSGVCQEGCNSTTHIVLEAGKFLLTFYVGFLGGTLVGSYIRQKNIQRNEDSQ